MVLGTGNVNSKILSIYHSSTFHPSTSSIPSGTQLGLILDKTNFYAEQGGQENDTGRIVIDGKSDFIVEDVQVWGGYVVHIGFVEEGVFNVGEEVVVGYDEVCFFSSLRSIFLETDRRFL